MPGNKVVYKAVHAGQMLWWEDFATDYTMSSVQVTCVAKKIDEEKEKGKHRGREAAQAMEVEPTSSPSTRLAQLGPRPHACRLKQMSTGRVAPSSWELPLVGR
jgi:hypothetical protein